MSRSGAARAAISAIYLFLDSEHQDCYASIADCLGETSQLAKPFPLLGLDVGDVLLTINCIEEISTNQPIDVRHTPPAAIKTMIQGLPNNLHKPSSQKPKLLVITYVRAHDKLDKHISDQVVIIQQILKGQLYLFIATFSCPQPPTATRYRGHCTRCIPPQPVSLPQKPIARFRGHPHDQRCPTQDVS